MAADRAEPAFPLVVGRFALVVVDMQNDFVRVDAPMEVPDARVTIPLIRRLVEAVRALGRPIVYTRFIAGPERTLLWTWSPRIAPPDCSCWPGFMREYPDVEGPRDGAAVVDELAPQPTDIVVDKYGYGAFHGTNLLHHLGARHVDTVAVVGTVTQICVDETVRGAFEQGLRAVVVSDGVSSYDPELHRATLRNIGLKFGRVMTADELISELRASAADGPREPLPGPLMAGAGASTVRA